MQTQLRHTPCLSAMLRLPVWIDQLGLWGKDRAELYDTRSCSAASSSVSVLYRDKFSRATQFSSRDATKQRRQLHFACAAVAAVAATAAAAVVVVVRRRFLTVACTLVTWLCYP